MPDHEILLKEIGEHHVYMRSMFELLVTWFIFFISVMTTAYSWVLGSKPDASIHRAVKPLGTFWLVQIALGIGACVTAMRYFEGAAAALNGLMAQLPGPLHASNAFPKPVIVTLCALMIVTLFANFGFWWWLMFHRRTGRQ
jgi:hypothetical protein